MIDRRASAPLSRRLLANLAGSWGAMALRLPVALVLTPFLLAQLGEERFGAFGVLLSLLAYLNLAGGPLHSSVTREMAHAGDDHERRSRVFSNSVIASILVSVVTSLIGFPLAGPLVDSLRVPANFRADAIASYYALVGTVLASLLATPFIGLLMSRNRYDLVDLVPALGQVVYAILAVAAFRWGGATLWLLGLAHLAAHVLAMLTLILLSRRHLGGARFHWRRPDWPEFRAFLGFSTQLLVINVSVLLTYQTDNLVISRLIGVGAVARYTVAASLILRFRQLCYGLSRTFLPAIADPATTPERRRDLHFRGTRYNTLLIVGLGGVAGALADPFYRLWLGESYVQSAGIFVLLMAANVFGMSQFVTNAVLTGLRHTRPLMVSEVIGAVANLVLSIALVKAGLGLTGVALGTLIPMVLRSLWLASHGASVVGAAIGPYLRRIYLPAIAVLGVTVAVLRALVGLGWTGNWMGLAAAAAGGFVVYGLLAVRLGLDAADRERVRELVRGLVHGLREPHAAKRFFP
jgi:O-antigen/teichoic acid export membrane protein